MNKSAKFWDRFANRYSKRPVPDEAVYKKKLEITQSYFHPDMQLLEFGCGTGSTALVHAPLVKHIRAIDFSGKMIEIAEAKRNAADIRNVSFELGTLDESDLAAHSFDIVLGLSILHLMKNWAETITRVYALLKPGGLFISSTACIADSMQVFKFIAPIGQAIGLLPELAVFTSTELEDQLRDAGFGIEQQWQPGKNQALFIVAKKPDLAGGQG